MKTQFDKEKQISHELRKQYSLILLRFKLAERKVYPNSCEIRIIVEEPSGSPKKQIDLGSEDSESIEDSDQEVSGISKETKKEESVKNKWLRQHGLQMLHQLILSIYFKIKFQFILVRSILIFLLLHFIFLIIFGIELFDLKFFNSLQWFKRTFPESFMCEAIRHLLINKLSISLEQKLDNTRFLNQVLYVDIRSTYCPFPKLHLSIKVFHVNHHWNCYSACDLNCFKLHWINYYNWPDSSETCN